MKNRIPAFKSGIGDNLDLKIKPSNQQPIKFDYSLYARGLTQGNSALIPEHSATIKIDASGKDYRSNDLQDLTYQVTRYPYNNIDFTLNSEVLAPSGFNWKLQANYIIRDNIEISMEELLGEGSTWEQFDHTIHYDTNNDADWELRDVEGINYITNNNNTYGLSGFYNPQDIIDEKENFTFEVDFCTTSSDDDTIGVFFGYKNDGDLYSFQIDNAGNGTLNNSHYMGTTDYRSGLFRYKIEDWGDHSSFNNVKQIIQKSTDKSYIWNRSSSLNNAKWHRIRTTINDNNVKIWVAKLWEPTSEETHVKDEYTLLIDYTDTSVEKITGAYGPCNASQPETYFYNLNSNATIKEDIIETDTFFKTTQPIGTHKLSDNKMSYYFNTATIASEENVEIDQVIITEYKIVFEKPEINGIISLDGNIEQNDESAYPYVILNESNMPMDLYLGTKTYSGEEYTELDISQVYIEDDPLTLTNSFNETFIYPEEPDFEDYDDLPEDIDEWPEDLREEYNLYLDLLEKTEGYEWKHKITNNGTLYVYFVDNELTKPYPKTITITDFEYALSMIFTKEIELSSEITVTDISAFGPPIEKSIPSFSDTGKSKYVLSKVGGTGNALAKFKSSNATTLDFNLPTTENINDKIEFILEEEIREYLWNASPIFKNIDEINSNNSFNSKTISIPISEFNISETAYEVKFTLTLLTVKTNDGTTNLNNLTAVFVNSGTKILEFDSFDEIKGTSLNVNLSSDYSITRKHSSLTSVNIINDSQIIKVGEKIKLYSFNPNNYSSLFHSEPEFYANSNNSLVKLEIIDNDNYKEIYATLPSNGIHEWPIEIHSGYYYFNNEEYILYASPLTIKYSGSTNLPIRVGETILISGYIKKDKQTDQYTNYIVPIELSWNSSEDWQTLIYIPIYFDSYLSLNHLNVNNFEVINDFEFFEFKIENDYLKVRTIKDITTPVHKNRINNYTLEIPTNPTQGMPIFIHSPTSPEIYFREVDFYDKNNNKTLVYNMSAIGKGFNKLFLDHKDVSIISVTKNNEPINNFLLGESFLYSNESWEGTYEIQYTLNNSFYLDLNNNNRSVTLSDNYPDLEITYENAKNSAYSKINNFNLNPLYSPYTQGFIYLTDSIMDPAFIDIEIHPNETKINKEEPVLVVATILDINKNPIANIPVDFKYNGIIKTKLTDEYGRSFLQIKDHSHSNKEAVVEASTNNLISYKTLFLF